VQALASTATSLPAVIDAPHGVGKADHAVRHDGAAGAGVRAAVVVAAVHDRVLLRLGPAVLVDHGVVLHARDRVARVRRAVVRDVDADAPRGPRADGRQARARRRLRGGGGPRAARAVTNGGDMNAGSMLP
jgi:hypothetical protein